MWPPGIESLVSVTERDPGQLKIPPGIAVLRPDAGEKLETLVAEAEQRQAWEIAGAAGAALDQAPAVLRRLMLRIFGV